MMNHKKERMVRGTLLLATIICGLISILIFFFLFYFSLPLLKSDIMDKFLISGWDPDSHMFGILPMIVGTIYISGMALIIGTPLGIGLAAFIYISSSNFMGKFFRYLVEFMSGIPTVVYGFAALFLLVPLIRDIFRHGSGLSILSASLVLSLVILPTIVLIAHDRFKEVPTSHILAAKSLGATDIQTFFYVVIPCAWRGIISAIVLGGGRAAGDTLIALMVAGNCVALPNSILDSARTLTSHIALITAADYESMSFKAIFACGLVLFVFTGWNILFLRVLEKIRK